MTIYQKIAEVDCQILDAVHGLSLDMDTDQWETKLRDLAGLIEDYFDLQRQKLIEQAKQANLYGILPPASGARRWGLNANQL